MPTFAQDQVPVVLLLLLTITSVGVVASTITNVDGIERSAPDVSFEPRGGTPDAIGANNSVENSTGDVPLDQDNEGVSLQFCVEPLRQPPAVGGLVVGVLGLLYGVSRRYNTATTLLLGTGLVPLLWGGYFLLTNCGYSGGDGGGGLLGGGSSVMTNTGGISSVPVPPSVFVGVFALVMVVGAVALFRSTSDDETFEAVEQAPEEADEAAFARAAGRAADRIEEANVPVDNAVYQAWLDMTRLLDIANPKTTAPRTFAEMAVEAGLDEADVSELTELFNEVRYGGMDPEEREDRAVEILRHIEATYQDSTAELGGEE